MQQLVHWNSSAVANSPSYSGDIQASYFLPKLISHETQKPSFTLLKGLQARNGGPKSSGEVSWHLLSLGMPRHFLKMAADYQSPQDQLSAGRDYCGKRAACPCLGLLPEEVTPAK